MAIALYGSYVPLLDRLRSLLRLAARRLRPGGRLVFLLPIPASSAAADALPMAQLGPAARCLHVERMSRQVVSRRMHRIMVTMIKVDEPAGVADGDVEDEGEEGRAPSTVVERTADAASVRRSLDGDWGGAAPWETWWRKRDE